MVITDASLVGAGCTLFHWQNLPELVGSTVAVELRKTLRIISDGTLKHNYDPGCWHVVAIGHWNGKSHSTRANYSKYEEELLSRILLLSGQGRLLGTNPLV